MRHMKTMNEDRTWDTLEIHGSHLKLIGEEKGVVVIPFRSIAMLEVDPKGNVLVTTIATLGGSSCVQVFNSPEILEVYESWLQRLPGQDKRLGGLFGRG